MASCPFDSKQFCTTSMEGTATMSTLAQRGTEE